MGLGTRTEPQTELFRSRFFTTEPTDRYRDRQKAIFFAADEKTFFFRRKDVENFFFDEKTWKRFSKTFFFDEKTFFFAAGQEKTFFLRQDRIDIGRCSVRCSDRTTRGQFGSVELPNHGTETVPKSIPSCYC